MTVAMTTLEKMKPIVDALFIKEHEIAPTALSTKKCNALAHIVKKFNLYTKISTAIDPPATKFSNIIE